VSPRIPVAVKMIHLRFLVGALGERLQWWPSRFTDEVGIRRLKIPFPRTALRAALESVTIAARRDHDDKLPPGCVHLFRLGSVQEDTIAHYLAQGVKLAPPPETADEILAQLDELGPQDRLDAPVGPCSLGREQRTRLNTAVVDMGRLYAGAARADNRVIPYFEIVEAAG